jgi:hypothetical protein
MKHNKNQRETLRQTKSTDKWIIKHFSIQFAATTPPVMMMTKKMTKNYNPKV